ncbi:MAG: ribosome biogenesis GTP-binding protein YihA/YsxC [Thiobacillaceae bacterium]|nr:ribosome biogenesis GTP-binding protein YihA/YsxC [Thiobacillaceae bacterium]
MLNAVFHTTVARLADLPSESLAEVAFVGRSNAGKSSAINLLANQKRLAFVSKTPGRTQHLNYFRVGEGRFLVDLPGYGFARAPLEQQRAWQSLAGDYLQTRPPLRGLVLIMDARHPLTDLDLQLLDWWRRTGKPVHVLLSKADKLSRGPALTALRAVRDHLAGLGLAGGVQLFSSPKRQGIEEAEGVLRDWLDLPGRATSNGPADAPTTDKKNPAQGEKAGFNAP